MGGNPHGDPVVLLGRAFLAVKESHPDHAMLFARTLLAYINSRTGGPEVF